MLCGYGTVIVMKKTLTRGTPITVTWVDITCKTDWIDVKDFESEEPVTIETRGVFISQDKKYLRIASTNFKDMEQIADRNIIPLSVITNIKRNE